MDTIEQFYKDFEVLVQAKENAGEHEAEYLTLLSGLSGTEGEKRLAMQLIVRFTKYFPQHMDRTLEGHFDMCEDENVLIRKHAIKNLATIVKERPGDMQRVSDVLIQLMATEDQAELNCIHNTIIDLIKVCPKEMLEALFATINYSAGSDDQPLSQEDEGDRHSAIVFICKKLHTLTESVMTAELEQMVFEKCKKVLQDVTGEEFVMLIKMLGELKSLNTLVGRTQIVQLIINQAALDEEFEATVEDVDKIITCAKQALPYMSKNVQSTAFLEYIVEYALPVLADIPNTITEASGEEKDDSTPAKEEAVNVNQSELLKVLAELTVYCGQVEDIGTKINCLYKCLLDFLPLPPQDTENTDAAFNFGFIECLLFTFHKLAAKFPEFLDGEEQRPRLMDLRIRLRYLDCNVKAYIKELRSSLTNLKPETLKNEENRVKVVALKTTNNISVLIKELFYNPPSYKSVINLSWKPLTKRPEDVGGANNTSSPVAGDKRPAITPVTFESKVPSKYERKMYSDRKLYQPPTGKYSDSIGSYQGDRFLDRGDNRRGGGNRFRGNFRRGRGRRW